MSYGMSAVPGSAGPGDELGLVAPAKALRLIHLLRSTLDELQRAPLDDATRRLLVTSHCSMLIEVASTVSDVLIDEMVRLHVEPVDREASVDQLEVAQAQLLGWLIGLFSSGGVVSGVPVSTDGAAFVFEPENDVG